MKQGHRTLMVAGCAFILVVAGAVADLGQSGDPIPQAGSPEQTKCLPFSLMAGVPVGAASVGIIESAVGVEGIPLDVPAVFFPPHEDGFITQSIALPPDLSLNQQLFVEVLYSGDIQPPSATEATVRLLLTFFVRLTEPLGLISGTGGKQEQSPQVAVGLKKATFGRPINQIAAQGDVMTLQLGRPAEENEEDTYPGIVQLEAVRSYYTPHTTH